MRSYLQPSMIVALLIGVCTPAATMAQAKSDRVRPSAYVSAEFCAALVIHPQRLAKATLFADLPVDKLTDAAGATAGTDIAPFQKLLKPEKISRVIFLLDTFPDDKTDLLPLLIVQYSEDVDGAAMFKTFFPNASSETHNGKTYLKADEVDALGQSALTLHVADRRTVVVGAESTLKKALEASPENNALLAQLRETSLDHDILAAFVMEPMIKSLERKMGMPIDKILEQGVELPTSLMQAKDLKSTAVTINLSGGTLAKVTVNTNTPEAATKFAAMANAGHAEAKKQYEAEKAVLAAQLPPDLAASLDALAQEVLGGVTITSSDTQVVIELKTPKGLAAVVAAAVKTLTDLAPKGLDPGGFGPGDLDPDDVDIQELKVEEPEPLDAEPDVEVPDKVEAVLETVNPDADE